MDVKEAILVLTNLANTLQPQNPRTYEAVKVALAALQHKQPYGD